MGTEKITYFFLHVGNGEVLSTLQEQTCLSFGKCRENPRQKWLLSSIIILCPVWLPQVNFLLEKIYGFTIKMYDLLAHGSLSTFKRFKFYTISEETASVINIPMFWKLQYTLFSAISTRVQQAEHSEKHFCLETPSQADFRRKQSRTH